MTDPVNVILGWIFSRRRHEMLISQAVLSESLGVEQSVLSRYESGVIPIQASTLVRLESLLEFLPGESLRLLAEYQVKIDKSAMEGRSAKEIQAYLIWTFGTKDKRRAG